MKPYYQDSAVTIYHGDCREHIPNVLLMGSVVICDPPYGISHSTSHGATWENTEIANDHDTTLRDWIVWRAEGLPMAIFGTWKASRPIGARAILVWDKGPAFGMGDLSFPWKNSWEEIYIYGDGWRGSRDEGVLRGHIVPSWESLGRQHPHEKPVSLMTYLIGKHTSNLIVDPTCGTGATLRAAKDLGRKAIGIEIEERYCEIAARRCAQEVLELGEAAARGSAPPAAP